MFGKEVVGCGFGSVDVVLVFLMFLGLSRWVV